MNNIVISGNLTRAPEYQETASGKSVVRFSVAVKNGRQDVDFIDVVAWEKTAIFCSKYLDKGRRVIISGRLQISVYENNAGEKRQRAQVVADRVEFADGRKVDAASKDAEDAEAPEEEYDFPF